MSGSRLVPLVAAEQAASTRQLTWLAVHEDGHPLGSAFLRLSLAEGQTHTGELQIAVHPEERRRGIGTSLLNAAVVAARDHGRRVLLCEAPGDSPGADFLAGRGFREVLAVSYATLPLTAVDTVELRRIVEQPHAGYRLTSWIGTVPDDLAESFASSRRAMDDMPMGDTDYGVVAWDVERVRSVAAAVARRGDVLRTIAAVDDASGDVVAFTELVVPAGGRGAGQHYGTGVLPEHRGRGLGMWMKAKAILDARGEHPELDGLSADTAEDNGPMLRINDALGYRPTRRGLHFQLDL